MPGDLWQIFGARLRQVRRRRDLTSQALADLAETQRGIISDIGKPA